MKIKHYLFSGHLEDGEEILHVAHRHPLILKINSFKTFNLGIILPIVLFIFFPQFLMIFIAWWVIGICGMIYHFIDWFFDAWLITTMGIIDVERNGLFDRSSTRIEYHMMEGLSYKINGFWPTMFNYGDITIDKVGAATSVVLKDAANPKKIERIVIECQDKYLSSKSYRDHNALKDMLSQMIAYHVRQGKIKEPPKSNRR